MEIYTWREIGKDLAGAKKIEKNCLSRTHALPWQDRRNIKLFGGFKPFRKFGKISFRARSRMSPPSLRYVG